MFNRAIRHRFRIRVEDRRSTLLHDHHGVQARLPSRCKVLPLESRRPALPRRFPIRRIPRSFVTLGRRGGSRCGWMLDQITTGTRWADCESTAETLSSLTQGNRGNGFGCRI